jgi:mono/diheme cytochrome c family protein
MPDNGGWLTSNINAQVGEPLHLRLVSDDVVHSFALGQSDFEPVDVLPGKPTDVTLTFDEPGIYTFYCTRWCGADHWRMRGTISVVGDEPVSAEPPAPPLYLQLGIDLDAPHENRRLDIEGQPSAQNGAALGLTLPPESLTLDYYQSHSPYQTWNDLRAVSSLSNLSNSQVWDLTAWVWQQNTSPTKLAEGGALYQRDCAACHGVAGGGDGVFALNTHLHIGEEPGVREVEGHSVEAPTNFKDANHMLFASPARLQGKIVRGGMGTGMPSWGLIYTEEQTWALVDYLWTFIFDDLEE